MALERANRILEKILNPDSGVHAVLLYGPRGSGKTKISNQLIDVWLGNERARDAYSRGANPDVLRISPLGKSSIIKVGQITAGAVEDKEQADPPLTEFVRMAPLYSEHKVVVMSDAHRMNNDASNALLKTLEEPPSYTKLILMTPTVSAMKPTILSRCLVVACELPSIEEFQSEFSGIDPVLKELSDGSPGVLEEMLKSPGVYLPFGWFADDLVKAKPREFLALSNRFKDIADALNEVTNMGARASSARAVELLATLLTRRHPNRPDLSQPLSQAHKRILGNAQANLVFDSVFAEILVK